MGGVALGSRDKPSTMSRRKAGSGARRAGGTSSVSSIASQILRQPQRGELPALMGVEEIAVAGPHMSARRGATAALQHELPGHELAVIFAHRAFRGAEPGMGAIGADRKRTRLNSSH